MSKRVKIGDIIEIETKRGFAYAQYVMKVPEWGALLRVLAGFYPRACCSEAAHVFQRAVSPAFQPANRQIRESFEIPGRKRSPSDAR